MSAPAIADGKAANGRIPFGLLAQHVFSLAATIEWFALEEAGCKPRWAWRDQETGRLCGSTASDVHLIDPLLFMVADDYDSTPEADDSLNPHRLRFVILAYSDLVQIVARFGPAAHASVAIPRGVDAYVLGTKLVNLLEGWTRPPVMQ